MTENITPFSFEGAQVRVVRDDDGEPWFVANDVCYVLGYSNPRDALAKNVDQGDVAQRDTIDGLGRTQQANHINESGLYSLIMSSRLESAKRFRRWVTSEVLPTIRKTGAYVAPHVVESGVCAVVRAMQLAAETVARVPGVRTEIVAAATLYSIESATGLPMEHLRKALPANTQPIASMNPTQLGERVGLSAREVNTRLASLGMQFRNPRKEWELTDTGKAHAEALPYANGKHAGYQILWRESVLEPLRSIT